jgi:hypothetical protein
MKFRINLLALFVLFLALKVAHIFMLPWWIVTMPLWFPLALPAVLVAGAVGIAGVSFLINLISRR